MRSLEQDSVKWLKNKVGKNILGQKRYFSVSNFVCSMALQRKKLEETMKERGRGKSCLETAALFI